MKKLTLLLGALMLGAAVSQAAPLTPGEALGRLSAECRMPMRSPALNRNATPALTVKTTAGTPAVYVFNRQEGGYLVVSGDTRGRALLGYSETGTLDPANMAPAAQWWLSQLAGEIGAAPEVDAMAQPLLSRAEDEDFAPIAPIVKTKWDQGAPYNEALPTIAGYHPWTGCVATAVAQIMNVHQWPKRGTGQYAYDVDFNGQLINFSMNFGETVFDWDNMLDTYEPGQYTAAQGEAVAVLMKAAGIASTMTYGLDQSGTKDIYAAAGLVKYLGYSPALQVVDRSWYFVSQWEELVYSQLAEGCPIVYGGATSKREGHEFVCDGYSQDGFFHFNWGWSGDSDGYFLLSALNPEQQGAGGAASSQGFNYEQSILINVRPPREGDELVPSFWCTEFVNKRDSYSRRSNISIPLDGGYYSMTTQPVKFEFGVRLVDEAGNEQFVKALSYYNDYINIGMGFGSYSMGSQDLPVGTYKVYPAFRCNGKWYQMHFDPTAVPPLIFNVEEDRVYISKGETEVDPDVLRISCEFAGWSSDELVITETYTASYTITVNQNGTYKFRPLLFNPTNDIMTRGNTQEVSFSKNVPQTVDFQVRIPSYCKPDVTYQLINTLIDAEGYILLGKSTPVNVVTESGIATIEAGTMPIPVATYDLQGRRVDNPTHGIYIERLSDGTARRVLIP